MYFPPLFRQALIQEGITFMNAMFFPPLFGQASIQAGITFSKGMFFPAQFRQPLIQEGITFMKARFFPTLFRQPLIQEGIKRRLAWLSLPLISGRIPMMHELGLSWNDTRERLAWLARVTQQNHLPKVGLGARPPTPPGPPRCCWAPGSRAGPVGLAVAGQGLGRTGSSFRKLNSRSKLRQHKGPGQPSPPRPRYPLLCLVAGSLRTSQGLRPRALRLARQLQLIREHFWNFVTQLVEIASDRAVPYTLRFVTLLCIQVQIAPRGWGWGVPVRPSRGRLGPLGLPARPSLRGEARIGPGAAFSWPNSGRQDVRSECAFGPRSRW